jgi:phosphate/sulfate permease
MAEIPIERKPRRSVSPVLLILLLIVIIAAGWYWYTNYYHTPASTTTSSITSLVRLASVSVPTVHGTNFWRV